MTAPNLKTVLTFDETTTAFRSVAHNLSAKKAEAKADLLRSTGAQVRVVDQPTRHEGQRLKTCELCKNAAESFSDHNPEGAAPEERSEDEPTAESGQ